MYKKKKNESILYNEGILKVNNKTLVHRLLKAV